MIIRLKSVVFMLFLLGGLALGAAAQVKYDYAVLTFDPSRSHIGVAEAGKEFRAIKCDILKPNNYDATPALDEVKKWEDNGWELFNTGFSGTGLYNIYAFYLRKPRQ